MPNITDVSFVLAVRDLDASTRYYIEVLGFTRDPIDAPGWSFLSKGAFKLMLGECPDERPASETGNHSWFARVKIDGLDDYCREIAARGATVLSAPADRTYGFREFVIRTPDGHRIMFNEPLATNA